MFDEIDGRFNEILEAGHTGVILAVGEGCRKFCVKQGNFVQVIYFYSKKLGIIFHLALFFVFLLVFSILFKLAILGPSSMLSNKQITNS